MILCRKFNEALYTKELARQKRDECRDENEKLKEVLRTYLNAINVSPETLKGKNSLLIVNGNHNLVRKLPKRPHVPAVDGNIVVNTYTAQAVSSQP